MAGLRDTLLTKDTMRMQNDQQLVNRACEQEISEQHKTKNENGETSTISALFLRFCFLCGRRDSNPQAAKH